MVPLLCFCCDHRNPAGAKFCNACGTPMHLKPCKHCEAINVRAAAHCHQCGETFALEYLSLVDETPAPDAPDEARGSAPVEASREIPSAPPPRRSAVFTTRIVALLLTLTATALVSAYYAYRNPANGLDAAGASERPPSMGSSALPVSPPAQAPAEQASPATADAPARSTVVAPETASEAKPQRAPAATVKRLAESASQPANPKRSTPSNASKAKAEPATRVSRPTAVEAVASHPPAGFRHDQTWQQPDAGPIALQQTAVAAPPRAALAPPAPVQRPQETAKRPTPAPGVWDRPCAEGVALDAGCDVRTMPKGN